MKKIVERFAAVLLVALMALLVMPAEKPVAASGSYTIYVQVPDNWGTPYIWTWNSSGDLFDSWPGMAMVDNGDGWYRYTLTTSYLDLIISNGGSIQTEDIRVNGKDVELVINDNATYEMKYRDSNATEWEDGITVTVSVPDNWKAPYIWAWDSAQGDVFAQWPGAAMNVAEGKYVMELPNWVTGIIINANNSAIQTMDINVEAGKDIWLTVNSADDVSVSYFGTESEEETTAEQTTTIAPSEDSGATTAPGTTTPGGTQDGGSDGDKPDTKRLLYIIIPVAVFVVIILIVTFTGNGKGKKHSKYSSEYDVDYRDIKIDEKELDVDMDVDISDDDLDV